MKKQRKTNRAKLIGYCNVDSGLTYIGDPSYLSNNGNNFDDWDKFAEKYIDNNKNGILKLHHKNTEMLGKGIVIKTGYGDGSYPVYVKHDENGCIVELTIKF